MYCSKCGTPHEAGATHCSRCGEPVGRPAAAPVPAATSYLAPAILVTLFCCLPFGIVAIVYAAQALSLTGAGDGVGALTASRSARTWCWASFLTGLGIWLLVVLVQLLVLAAACIAAVAGAQ